MKRNLQDDQWAKNLRDWEDTPTTDAWGRPSADMWERIAEDLPPKKSKRVIAWWISTISIMAAISIGVAMYLMFQTNDGVVDKEEVVVTPTSNNQNSNGSAADIPSERSESRGSNLNSNTNTNTNNQISNLPDLNLDKVESDLTAVSSGHATVSDVQQSNQIDLSINNANVDNQSVNVILHPSDPVVVESPTEKNDILQILRNQVPNLNIVRQSSFITSSIPTLNFKVKGGEFALETQAVLPNTSRSLWSMDVYTQKRLKEPKYIQSPFIQRQQEKLYSYGVQLNRELGKGFSMHLGLQQSIDVTKGKNRFVRFFDRNNEMEDGMHRISEFNLTTQLGGNDPIDDNVKIERDDSQEVEDQTRLIFEIERKFSLKSISIPLQLSYSIWTEYPFQLSAMLGAKYSRIERTIEKGGVTIINPEFRIRQFNAGRPAVLAKETTSNIVAQGGLRLDVHLSPKLSAVTQLEFQGKSSKLPWRSVGGGSSVRLGLSYSF